MSPRDAKPLSSPSTFSTTTAYFSDRSPTTAYAPNHRLSSPPPRYQSQGFRPCASRLDITNAQLARYPQPQQHAGGRGPRGLELTQQQETEKNSRTGKRSCYFLRYSRQWFFCVVFLIYFILTYTITSVT